MSEKDQIKRNRRLSSLRTESALPQKNNASASRGVLEQRDAAGPLQELLDDSLVVQPQQRAPLEAAELTESAKALPWEIPSAKTAKSFNFMVSDPRRSLLRAAASLAYSTLRSAECPQSLPSRSRSQLPRTWRPSRR